jgi:hypothetical protein
VWQSPNPAANETPLLVAGQTVTNGIGGVFWNTGSTAHVYLQAVTPGTATLVYSFYGTGEAEGIVSRASMKLTAVNISIVPDYDRDRAIDSSDINRVSTNEVFRWWINDDVDALENYDGASGTPGSSPPNHGDNIVNGPGDLLDFTPVWLDLHGILNTLPDDGLTEYRLRQQDNALNMLLTDLTADNAGSFLTVDSPGYGPAFDQEANDATLLPITVDGTPLPDSLLAKIRGNRNKGVVLIEGAEKSTEPLIMEVLRDEIAVCSCELPLSIDSVEKMFRRHNFRHSPNLDELRDEPDNRPDSLCKNVDVFMAHGYRVGEDESRAWGAEIFKHLYEEGMNARFHSVTWSSDSGSRISYEDNVHIAFSTASNYAARVKTIQTANNSEIIVIGHSLGCMLTAAAIEDYDLPADKFLRLMVLFLLRPLTAPW